MEPARPLTVLVVHPHLAKGDGTARYLADVAAMLAAGGCAVTVESAHSELELGASVHAVDCFPSSERVAPFDFALAADADVLRQTHPRARQWIYAALDWYDQDIDRERWALDASDLVLRFTPRAVHALEVRHGCSLVHKSLAAVFVPLAFERAECAAPRHEASPPELLWVGRLHPRKDVAFLLRAWALVTEPFRGVVCGTGPERSRLEASARSLGLHDRVTFEGLVEDVAPFYRRAALFCTASPWEQYSLTILEAAAYGVPTLGRRPNDVDVFNSCPEQIVSGETGALFETPAELARQIDALLRDPKKRRRWGDRARAHKREFTALRFQDALLAAIRERARDRAK